MAPIVQYIVVRGDLLTGLRWPVGALIAQACHAATAVIHMFYQDQSTQLYLKDLDNMHKIILEVKPILDTASPKDNFYGLLGSSVAYFFFFISRLLTKLPSTSWLPN